MSFEKLTRSVLSGSWDVGSRHNGNPADNDLIKAVGKKHNVGFFESIHKLLRRSAIEDEETCSALWESNLISFKNNNTGKEYTLHDIGSLSKLYDELDNE